MRRDSSCLVGGIFACLFLYRIESRYRLIHSDKWVVFVGQFVVRDKQAVIETSWLEDTVIEFEVEDNLFAKTGIVLR